MKLNSAIPGGAFLMATSAIGDRIVCYDCITTPLAEAAYCIIWPQKIDVNMIVTLVGGIFPLREHIVCRMRI